MLGCMNLDQYEYGSRGLSGCGIALGFASYFLTPIIQVAVGAGVFYLFSNDDLVLCARALNVTQKSQSADVYVSEYSVLYGVLLVCCSSFIFGL